MSTGAFTEIPLIDLGAYFAGDRASKRRVAEEISRACERIGFSWFRDTEWTRLFASRRAANLWRSSSSHSKRSLPSGGNRTTCQSGATSRSAPSISQRRLVWRRRPT